MNTKEKWLFKVSLFKKILGSQQVLSLQMMEEAWILV